MLSDKCDWLVRSSSHGAAHLWNHFAAAEFYNFDLQQHDHSRSYKVNIRLTSSAYIYFPLKIQFYFFSVNFDPMQIRWITQWQNLISMTWWCQQNSHLIFIPAFKVTAISQYSTTHSFLQTLYEICDQHRADGNGGLRPGHHHSPRPLVNLMMMMIMMLIMMMMMVILWEETLLTHVVLAASLLILAVVDL